MSQYLGQDGLIYIMENLNSVEGETIEEIKTQYAVSESKSQSPTDGWTDEKPEVGEGEYLWSRVSTIFKNGTITVHDERLEVDTSLLEEKIESVGASVTDVETGLSDMTDNFSEYVQTHDYTDETIEEKLAEKVESDEPWVLVSSRYFRQTEDGELIIGDTESQIEAVHTATGTEYRTRDGEIVAKYTSTGLNVYSGEIALGSHWGIRLDGNNNLNIVYEG